MNPFFLPFWKTYLFEFPIINRFLTCHIRFAFNHTFFSYLTITVRRFILTGKKRIIQCVTKDFLRFQGNGIMKKSKTSVSIIIAAYKGEKYIGALIRSLFSQTLLPDEILIGDDSSDDLTEKAVQAVLKDAPESIRITYFRNPQPFGVVQNFSKLAELAAGEYIFFCDQDDIWLENKVKVMVDAMIDHPDRDLGACDSIRTTADLQPAERVVNPKCLSDRDGEFFRNIWKISGIFPGHNLVLRKSGKSGVLPFPEGFLEYHDRWMILFYGVKNKIIYKDQVLTLYRIHENNVSKPQTHGYNMSFFERLHEIRMKSGKDLQQTLEQYLQYRELLLERIPFDQLPVANVSYMNDSISFFQWRVRNHNRKLHIFRMIGAILHFPGYFRFSNGIHSFLRDCIF